MRVVLVIWGFERFGGMERHVVQLAIGLHRAGTQVAVFSEMPVARANAYARALRGAGVALSTPPRLVWIANAAQIALWPSPARRTRLIHGGGLLSGWLMRRLQRRAANTAKNPPPLGEVDREARRRGWFPAKAARAVPLRQPCGLPPPPGGEDFKKPCASVTGIDLIHIHGCRLGQAWLLAWAKARGIATVYTEHVTITDAGGPLTAHAPMQARDAGVLACVSEHSRASLAAQFSPPPPIAVTGHIVAPCADRRQPDPAELILLCPARLEWHKGVDVLLRAFAVVCASLANIRLIIAGSGHREAELKRLAVALGIRARTDFVGMLSPAQMADRLAQADIVALPSRSEALPLALLEAMACAKPIVATHVGGIPELIAKGENGLLVPPDDVAALAAAIGCLATDPQLRAALGANAQRSFAHSRHHESRVIPEMLDLYRQATQRC